jgi:glycine/D-amino acid oxidase-like deaminating enzyme
MSEIRVPVLVVGGGGAGLCASIFLSSHGVEHLRLERHDSTSNLLKARTTSTSAPWRFFANMQSLTPSMQPRPSSTPNGSRGRRPWACLGNRTTEAPPRKPKTVVKLSIRLMSRPREGHMSDPMTSVSRTTATSPSANATGFRSLRRCDNAHDRSLATY